MLSPSSPFHSLQGIEGIFALVTRRGAFFLDLLQGCVATLREREREKSQVPAAADTF